MTRVAISATALMMAVMIGCSVLETGGSIVCSQPQVHSRERQIDQRSSEVAWLRRQRDLSDAITTRFQGLHDFRQFTGIYNELTASANPAKGQLNALELEAQESDRQAEVWHSKRRELAARRAYQDALDNPDTAGDSPSPANADQNAQTDVVSRPSGFTPPFGEKYSDLQPLPNPRNVEKTLAEAGLLDLFHDRLAYRNAVNAAMKEADLDDSHDFAGSTLYELTFNVSVIPGSLSDPLIESGLWRV